MQGNYPVVREDAAQMCALQIQAEAASTLLDNEEGIMQCMEKYITKQVGPGGGPAPSREGRGGPAPSEGGGQVCLCVWRGGVNRQITVTNAKMNTPYLMHFLSLTCGTPATVSSLTPMTPWLTPSWYPLMTPWLAPSSHDPPPSPRCS